MRTLRLLTREDGTALVMALGIVVVLALSSATAVYYSSANARSATASKSDGLAFSLSEAGLNEAASVLGNEANNPLHPALLSTPRTTTYETGTVTWWGVLDQPNQKWSLTSIGKVTNPTGNTSTALQRTMTATVQVTPRHTQPQQNTAWDYVFVWQTGNTCDMTTPSNYVWNSPLYVFGNLCLANNSQITGGPLVVRSRLDLSTSSSAVGTSGSQLSSVQIGTGCQYASGHWHPDATHPTHGHCSSVDNVWASGGVGQNPPTVTIPVANFPNWYANAMPGPGFACTASTGTPPTFDGDTVMNTSVAMQNLTPGTASYSCRVGRERDLSATPPVYPSGELSWNHVTRKLYVYGTIFIDGPIQVNPGAGAPIDYDGNGSIYTSGTFTLASNMKLCVNVSGLDCDFAGWNPNTDMIVIVANGAFSGVTPARGISIASGTRFQGALYATNQVELAASAKTEGPLVAPSLQLGAGASSDPWNTVDSVPSAMPGEEIQYAYANPPSSFSG